MVAYVQLIPEKVSPEFYIIGERKRNVLVLLGKSFCSEDSLGLGFPWTGLKDLQVPGEPSKNHWVRTALPPGLDVVNKANSHACCVT